MRTPALVIATLLACGCATTVEPASDVAGMRCHLAWEEVASTPASEPFAPAWDPEAPASLSSLAQEAAAASSSPAGTESPHSFSGGVGVRIRDGESAVNLVGEYHYAISPALDVGGIADWAGSPINSLLIAPAAWLHPDDHLTLFGAPGVEFISGRGGKGAVRLGGSYLIQFGRIALRPFGWYDIVTDRKNSFALGVAIGV